MKKILNKVPLGFSAVALSLLVVGNVVGPSTIRNILGIFAGLFIIVVITKICMSIKIFLSEVENPVVLSTLATLPMSFAILATYLVTLSPIISKLLWVLGIIGHIVIIVKLCTMILQSKKILPSYYVTFVGIIAFTVSSKAVDFVFIGNILLWLGIISFVVLTPFVFKTLIDDGVPALANPTKVIVAAPLSLIVVGYLTVIENINLGLITSIYLFSVIFTVIGIYYLVKSIQLKANPTYGAYTFPLAISTLSSLRMKTLYAESSFASNIAVIYYIEFALCIVAIIFVILQYTRLAVDNNKKEEN